MTTKKTITCFNDLPITLQKKVRKILRGEDTEVSVIRWNGRIRVVGKVYPHENARDEKILFTIHETDIFTVDECAENYINHYLHQYYSKIRTARIRPCSNKSHAI